MNKEEILQEKILDQIDTLCKGYEYRIELKKRVNHIFSQYANQKQEYKPIHIVITDTFSFSGIFSTREKAQEYIDDQPSRKDYAIEMLNIQEQLLISSKQQPKQVSDEEIEERLVKYYKAEPVAVEKVCDEILDRTGALLGRVRTKSRIEQGIMKS